ncbi:MAG: hypothetical protein ACHQIG_13725 [Acidimicrobiia bacterium]
MVPGWKLAAVLIVVLTAVVTVAMVLTGMGPRLVLVVALGAVIGVSAWLLVTLARFAAPAAVWDTAAEPRDLDRDTALPGAPRYRIPGGPYDQRVADRLHGQLVELIDDRLTAAYGISRSSDPDAARAIIGDDLASFVDDPGASRSLTDLANVERVVSRIEQL